jgi:hypothetical protein
MRGLLLLPLATAAAAGCASVPPPRLTTWAPDEIIVPASVKGRIRQDGECLIIERERGRRQFLVWPEGSRIEGRSIVWRGDSGRTHRTAIGAHAHLEGEPLLAEHGHYLPEIHAEAARCGALAFLVRDVRQAPPPASRR